MRVGSATPKRPWLTAHAGVSPGHAVQAVREGRFRSGKATLAHRPRGGGPGPAVTCGPLRGLRPGHNPPPTAATRTGGDLWPPPATSIGPQPTAHRKAAAHAAAWAEPSPLKRAATSPTEARSQGRPKAAAQRCEASLTASVGLVRARPPTTTTTTNRPTPTPVGHHGCHRCGRSRDGPGGRPRPAITHRSRHRISRLAPGLKDWTVPETTEDLMSKTGRKRRGRKKKSANHGKRPNA